jgi:Flp pilus assembly pilin Flp
MASLSSPIRPTIDVVARTVSSSAISGGAGGGIPGTGGGGGRGGALAIQPQASLVNVERNLEIQTTQNVQQTQEISALRSAVDALRTETTTLNKGLVSITKLIQQDSALEKQQEAEKAESERKLAETNVRLGKESQLEQRITNSLVTPVQALQQKVGNIFARIGEALTTLFFGWLTNQGIEALKAASEGNKEKLEEIKDNVLNGIGDAIKVFTAIKTGFNLIIKTITGVTGRIAGFVTRLALAPVKALTNALRGAPLLQNIFPGPKKPGGGGGGGGLLGGVITGISGALNFLNGENADAALAGISLLPLPGKVGLAVKVLAGGIFAIDDVLEVFDKNFIGADPKALSAKRKELEEAKRNQTNQKPTSATSTTAAKVTSTSTAQTPMMGDKNKKDGVEANVASGSIPSDSKGINPTSSAGSSASSTGTSAPSTTSTTSGSSSSSTAQTPMMSPSSAATTAPPAAESQTSMAPQASELSLNNNPPGAIVPGQRPDKALNSEQFKAATQAREEAKVQGLSGKELEIYVANAAMNAKPSDVNISSPAQVQPLPKPTQNVGELSEPAPNVVMMPSGQSNNQQSSISQAPTNGTDTPLISSSNPDNFYVLYSQLNYNVVI